MTKYNIRHTNGDILFKGEYDSFKKCVEGAVRKGVDLSGGDFSFINLRKADLENANLSNAKLFKANLEHANLMGVNLHKATLSRANLDGTNLIGANIEEIYLDGAYQEKTNIQNYLKSKGAILTNVRLN